MGIIYKATNRINNKVYIGQTIRTLKKRITQHKRVSNKVITPFYNAILKYGFDNFIFEILCYSEDEDLNEMEIFFISLYNSHIEANKEYLEKIGSSGDIMQLLVGTELKNILMK